MRAAIRNQWAGLLALFLVLAGGGAYAAFDPIGSDGDIDACFDRRSGDLDLLKGKRCGKREKPVTWSVEGPQGPQGDPGAQGAQGPAGTPGAAGAAGTARAHGLVNSVGALFHAKNATVVKPPATTGIYCIDPGAGIDADTAVLLLTIDSADSNTGAKAEWDSSPGAECAADALAVRTYTPANAPANEAFSFAIP